VLKTLLVQYNALNLSLNIPACTYIQMTHYNNNFIYVSDLEHTSLSNSYLPLRITIYTKILGADKTYCTMYIHTVLSRTWCLLNSRIHIFYCTCLLPVEVKEESMWILMIQNQQNAQTCSLCTSIIISHLTFLLVLVCKGPPS